MEKATQKRSRVWTRPLLVAMLGLVLGTTATVMLGSEGGDSPSANVELAAGPNACDPPACYHFQMGQALRDQDIVVTVVKSDGNCSTSTITSRVTDYIKDLGNGKRRDQNCTGVCGCENDITLNAAGGTEDLTLPDIDVAALWGHCIVTVKVKITYTAGGTGTLGHCIKVQA